MTWRDGHRGWLPVGCEKNRLLLGPELYGQQEETIKQDEARESEHQSKNLQHGARRHRPWMRQ